jgi:hypothetical protein
MPHELHVGFAAPSDENTVIWRYMDLARCLDLIVNRRLTFASLGRMQDKFEGTLPLGQQLRLLEALRGLGQANPMYLAKVNKAEPEMAPRYAAMARSGYYVNCWAMGEDESEAMWRCFAPNGVAVRSSYARLCSSLSVETIHKVWIGVVRYGDLNDPALFEGNPQNLCLYKRPLFRSENELRAVICTDMRNPPTNPVPVLQAHVDIRTLIESVYVAPEHSSWFDELMSQLLQGFNLEVLPVKRSQVNANPWSPKT